MKNLLAIFLMVFLFASCEGPMGPPGRDGEDGTKTYWIFDKDIPVMSGDWEFVENKGEPFYMYEYKISDEDFDLYKDAYDEGLITCYMYLDYNTSKEAQTALPNPVNRLDSENNIWTETYAAEYTKDGFIIFKVTFSDFFTDQRPPETHFNAVITY